ncbi:hypothetical protein C0J52_02870 [Blattella germanica]|nr:hypothetical protein C0J52_02870 [Blattella germanica]
MESDFFVKAYSDFIDCNFTKHKTTLTLDCLDEGACKSLIPFTPTKRQYCLFDRRTHLQLMKNKD